MIDTLFRTFEKNIRDYICVLLADTPFSIWHILPVGPDDNE
jgi:hypothetical protein